MDMGIVEIDCEDGTSSWHTLTDSELGALTLLEYLIDSADSFVRFARSPDGDLLGVILCSDSDRDDQDIIGSGATVAHALLDAALTIEAWS